MIVAFALGIGIVAGLRAAMPFAIVSWAARLGHLHLQHTWAGFMGAAVAPWIASVGALGELINDKNPKTPSRKVWFAFIGRILSGAFAGGCIGLSFGQLPIGAVCGAVGAVIGTLGGAAARGALARAFGRDLPAALLEDALAITIGVLIVCFV